jgi:hypothetical protein
LLSCQVPTGEIGEVSIKGANVTKGYKANPEANKVAFTSGWFHTGDRGKLDSEGYLMLTGRIKELINRGGELSHTLSLSSPLVSPGVTKKSVEIINRGVSSLHSLRLLLTFFFHARMSGSFYWEEDVFSSAGWLLSIALITLRSFLIPSLEVELDKSPFPEPAV